MAPTRSRRHRKNKKNDEKISLIMKKIDFLVPYHYTSTMSYYYLTSSIVKVRKEISCKSPNLAKIAHLIKFAKVQVGEVQHTFETKHVENIHNQIANFNKTVFS